MSILDFIIDSFFISFTTYRYYLKQNEVERMIC